MTRLELYERVWQTPMTKLAPEFGVSDVALAKLCRKHAVPTPPRGYWAQLAAGQKPRRAKLPSRDVAGEIEMPGSDKTLRAKRGNRVARDKSIARPSETLPDAGVVHFRPTLAGTSPMIRATAAFFEEKAGEVAKVTADRKKPHRPGELRVGMLFPRSVNGRFAPNSEGCLDVLASLEHIRWILLFHDALFRELRRLGADVRPCEKSPWKPRHSAEVVWRSHGLALGFVEGFARPAGETRSVWFSEHPYTATDDCKLVLDRHARSTRIWRGSRAQLEQQIGKIARGIIDTIADEAVLQAARVREEQERMARQERYAAEAKVAAEARQIAAEERARQEARLGARRAQAGRALRAGHEQLEYEATLRVLADIEARLPVGDEGEGLRTWLAVARDGLKAPVDELLAEIVRELAPDASPQWWPPDASRLEWER